jgi:hypothetical protein
LRRRNDYERISNKVRMQSNLNNAYTQVSSSYSYLCARSEAASFPGRAVTIRDVRVGHQNSTFLWFVAGWSMGQRTEAEAVCVHIFAFVVYRPK